MHTISTLMRKHNVERIVLVEDQHFSDFVVPGRFHAWPRDGGLNLDYLGVGPTAEAAILDMVARAQRRAA